MTSWRKVLTGAAGLLRRRTSLPTTSATMPAMRHEATARAALAKARDDLIPSDLPIVERMNRLSSSTFASSISHARTMRQPLLAFNVVDPASIFGVAAAAAEAERPVILQASARTVSYYGAELLRHATSRAKARFGIDCFLHLDHCIDEGLIQDAIDARFDGFMIDASALPLDENIRLTAKFVNRGHASGLVVEGELGPIRGTEEGAVMHSGQRPPDVKECLHFQEATGVDLFGSDIGTAHGLYRTAPAVNFSMVEELAVHGRAGLVVHGGTGLADDVLRRLADLGAAKINFSTALKHAWGLGVLRTLQSDANPEPLRALQSAQTETKNMALALFQVFIEK